MLHHPRLAPILLIPILVAGPSDPLFGQEFETNHPASTLMINGLESNGSVPAVTNALTNQDVWVTFSSTSLGLPWEIAVGLMPLVPLSGGGMVVSGGNILNIQPNDPALVFLNGGMGGPSFQAYPGNAFFPVSVSVPVIAAAQMINADPAAAAGVVLSQGIQVNLTQAQPLPGPILDDSDVLVNYGSFPLGGPSWISFYGTAYTRMVVCSNGRIMFGLTSGDNDYAPSVSDGLVDNPFVGFWSDLNPAMGGSITVSAPNPIRIRVDYQNIHYYDEPTAAISFGIEINHVTGEVILDGLTGIVPNPQIGPSAWLGDNQWLGITRGNTGATDGGPTFFSAGGAGALPNPTDMIYEVYNRFLQTGGIVTSLAAGTLDAIIFVPTPAGGYTWVGV